MGQGLSTDMINSGKLMFDQLDKDHRGHIPFGDLQALYSKLHPGEDPSKFELNSQKSVKGKQTKCDIYEFMGFVERELAVPFNNVDQNKSGRINKSQLKQALVKMGHKVTDEGFEAFLKASNISMTDSSAINFEQFMGAAINGIQQLYQINIPILITHELQEMDILEEHQSPSLMPKSQSHLSKIDQLVYPEARPHHESKNDRRYMPLSLFRRSTSPSFASTVSRFPKQPRSIAPDPGYYEYWKADDFGTLQKQDIVKLTRSKKKPQSPNQSKSGSQSVSTIPRDSTEETSFFSTPDMIHLRMSSNFASRVKRMESPTRLQTSEFIGPGTYHHEVYRPKSASIAPFGRPVKVDTDEGPKSSSPAKNVHTTEKLNPSIEQLLNRGVKEVTPETKKKQRPSSAFASTTSRFPTTKTPSIDFRGVEENQKTFKSKTGISVPEIVPSNPGGQFGLASRSSREVIVNCKNGVHLIRTFYANAT